MNRVRATLVLGVALGFGDPKPDLAGLPVPKKDAPKDEKKEDER